MAVTCTNVGAGNVSGTSLIVVVPTTPHNILLFVSCLLQSTGLVPDLTVSGLGLSWSLLARGDGQTSGSSGTAGFLFLGTGNGSAGNITVTSTGGSLRMYAIADDVAGATISSATATEIDGAGVRATSASGGAAAHYGYVGLHLKDNPFPTFAPPAPYTLVASGNEGFASAGTFWGGQAPSSGTWNWVDNDYWSLITADLVATATSGGSADGTIDWAGAATGEFIPDGSAGSGITWTGAATGISPNSGSASGTLHWDGEADGAAPGAANKGEANGSVRWTGTANGAFPREGSVSGAISWRGSASGRADPSGAVSGELVWTGEAFGQMPYNEGYAFGGLMWRGYATGERPRIFEPPVVLETATDEPGLFTRMQMERGVTVLKKDGFYTQVRFPSPEEIDAADIAYLGGHIYQITAEEAADLIAAGYEVTL